jgi:hypothetical protein
VSPAAATRSEMSAMLESKDDMQYAGKFPPQEPIAGSRSYSICQSTSQLLTMTYIVFLIT